jgi:hypothetical protein
MERNMNLQYTGRGRQIGRLQLWSRSSCLSYLNPFPLQCRIARNLPFRRLAIPTLPLTKSEGCCCPRRVVFLAQCHNLTRQYIGPYQTPCHSGTSCCLRACQITKRNYSGLRPGALGKTSLYERCTIQVDCLRGMSQPFQVQVFFLNIARTLAINSCIGQEQRPRCHVFGIYSRSSSLSTTLMDPGNLHFLQKLYSPAFRCSKSDRAFNDMARHQFY